jgi:predicted glycogen debranching enzyme
MISLGTDICADFDAAASREWLETNGIGGFASGTVAGSNSRRYHGLLVAAIDPPVERAVMLSKFEEALTVDGVVYNLSANQYPGAIFPQGFKYLTNFRLDPFPVWTFKAGGIEIEKSVFMVYGENTTVIEYRALSGLAEFAEKNVSLELRPLMADRHYHYLGAAKNMIGSFTDAGSATVNDTGGSMPPVYFSFSDTQASETNTWYRNFEYAIEQERGFDFREDLFNPFALTFDLSPRGRAAVIISTAEKNISDAPHLRAAEITRRNALTQQAGADNDFIAQLTLAADQFIVARGEGKTVIAGYPWFTDWGRDTMIALPGLTIATKRFDVAESILFEFSKHISQGMLPNRFPDGSDEPEYNTVDATLWYFEAVRACTAASGNYSFVKDHLYEKLRDILTWHIHGTRYRIKVDPADGLLNAGETGVQLTWMDAKIGDWVVTPRSGKAVEIQALWYNALRVMEHFAEHFGDENGRTDYRLVAEYAASNFESTFWNENEQCLYDVVTDKEKDGSVRPNQIFAVSLPYTMLSEERSRMVVEKVRDELLTPVGLRSLSPKDKRYVPVYIGSPLRRDGSYHQGTVWGWLIGPYITAHQKVFGAENLPGLLAGFVDHINEAGLGSISEIFDGDAPHRARGCMAQAWSVAEVLRVLT